MSTAPTTADRQQALADQLYTADDLAARLQCSVRHVWRLHDSGALPAALRVGRLVRWPKPLIDRWLADGCPPRRR